MCRSSFLTSILRLTIDVIIMFTQFNIYLDNICLNVVSKLTKSCGPRPLGMPGPGCCHHSGLHKLNNRQTGLGWAGLGWAGLGWAGLPWLARETASFDATATV